MPKKVTHSTGRGIYNITENVCPTSDAYTRALEYFRAILLERVTQHEDEVFSARARFQMQRNQDREHFERSQRRRQRAENGSRSRLTVLQQLEQGVGHSGDIVSEPMSSAEEAFRADQQKLYIEHEEELQEAYPLAFLSEESAGVVAFTLLPMLRGKLMALGQQRTEGLKEQMKVLEENGYVRSTVNNHNNTITNVLSTRTPEERTVVVEKVQPTTVKNEHEQGRDTTVPEIGRGAYIIPLSHASPPTSKSCRTGGVESNNVRPDETHETEEVVEEEQQEKGEVSNSVIQAPWLTNLTTQGAVEFVRIAFICNEQYRQERYNEKRRFLESCLSASTTRAKQRVVRRLLRRVKEDELHDMKRMAKMFVEWQDVRERVIGNSEDTVLDDTKVTTVSESKDKTVEAWISPSDLRRERRRVRMEIISSNENGNEGKNRTTHVSPSVVTTNTNSNRISTTATSTITNSSCRGCTSLFAGRKYPYSFDTTNWVTIPLDDHNNNNNNSNEGMDLEAIAESYMWPQHIEASISNVLCGEVVRSGKRWLLFQSDFVGKGYSEKIEEEDDDDSEDGNKAAEDHVHTQGKRGEVEKMFAASLPVVTLPQQGKKVWLKVNTLGDFIAGEVKFYQSHSPL
ncbi:hypothetical protein LSM04_000731 [Trypanosoma melophagium]|uniref:uncharacterized protein n=1 Tax=Trypanosoma melophagium TaxID=715481 RepID=UPI003519F1E9|nr:hypothetical protein LSM04_000731 [Trypanosoma melophagium]